MLLGLDLPRELGDARIAARTAAMFELGVEAEVRDARHEHRFSHTAARIHGLQDVSALLDGEIDRAEAITRLAVRTRRYAKRQRTWMRRLATVPLDATHDPAANAALVEGLL